MLENTPWVNKSMNGTLRKNERFNKDRVAHVLARKIFYMAQLHNFDHHNGYAQVEGKGEAVNRDYGEYLGCIHAAMGLGIEKEVWSKVEDWEHDAKKNRLTM